jgi:hypothetical protein
MATSETTMLSSTNQEGKEHSNALFINEILVKIIIINIYLILLSYCG